MFMLIIWLQGIWLPQHGYSFHETPLYAGIYMLPLTVGMLARRTRRPATSPTASAHAAFATGGMLLTALGFGLLMLLPTDFSYPAFAAILLLIGASMGMFASPNRAAVMNSLPPQHRGAGGAMNQTFQNSAQVLSIGIFFTLMIIGLSSDAAAHAERRPAGARRAGGRPRTSVATLPPVSILFAAFLGYNPIEHLVGADVLAALPAPRPGRADRPLASSPRSSPARSATACTRRSRSRSSPA